MPCPAFGLWVWQASPAMNTLGSRRRDLALRYVVELVRQPLADVVNRPPGHLLGVKLIGMENPLRLGDQFVERDVAARDPLAGFERGQLDVEADR